MLAQKKTFVIVWPSRRRDHGRVRKKCHHPPACCRVAMVWSEPPTLSTIDNVSMQRDAGIASLAHGLDCISSLDD
jgi:hypothetical protein